MLYFALSSIHVMGNAMELHNLNQVLLVGVYQFWQIDEFVSGGKSRIRWPVGVRGGGSADV